jgi:lysyl-tRNA synthetase class 2
VAEILAPSDAVRARVGAHLRVGGRVVAAHGRSLRLADAFAVLDVVLSKLPAAVASGDLVVAAGRLRKKRLVDAKLVERHAAPETTGRSETARLAWQGVGGRLLARHEALRVIRRYFQAQRFIEVDTPQRVRSPALDLNVEAFVAEGGFLVTSPEFQMKRLLVGGIPRSFQLAHCFRKSERGALHEPEFTMLEWYRAFAGVEAVMRDTERLVLQVVEALSGRRSVAVAGRRVDVAPPFERITIREAFRRHAGIADACDLAETSPDRFFELFVRSVEPALAARPRALFLHDYPISQASLARPSPADPRVAERFELYVGGVELCNGFGELTDAREQRARFRRDRRERRRLRRPVPPIDGRFLAALEEGMAPSAGNALGVDRLLYLALGASSVAEVQAFPAAWL